MGLNLKLEFIEYLRNKNEEDNTFLEERGLDVDNLNEISIFLFSKEFKEFIQDEYKVSQDFLSLNISDIDDLELRNGKLVNIKEEEAKEEAEKETTTQDVQEPIAEDEVNAEEEAEEEANEEATQSVPESITEEGEMQPNQNMEEGLTTNDDADSEEETVSYIDILNAMFEDEEFLKEFDTDKDGIINKNEFLDFQEKIKGLDGQEENLSIEDIITKSTEFTANPKDNIEGMNQPNETETLTPQTETPTETPTAATPSGGTSGGGGGSYSYNPTSTQPKGLESMTVEELQSELATAQDNLSQKQETLTNISNGTDSKISSYKEDMETSLKEYNETLKETDNKDAKELASVNKEIANKEQAIQDNDNTIFNQEAIVQQMTEASEVALANYKDLESKQQALNSTDTSEMSETQRKRIEERKKNIGIAITKAEKDKETADKNKTEAEKQLTNLEKEKKKLEDGKPTLTELEEKRTQLEENLSNLLSKEPLKSLKEAYETAKTTYETESASALTKAQNAVTEASNEVTKINDALQKVQEKENNKNYSPTDIRESIVEFAKQFLGNSEDNNLADKFVQQYGNYDSSTTPWCAAFVEYVLRNSGEYDSIPEWYKTANGSYDAPKWGCTPVLNSAPQGARRDVNSAKPGDLILFNWSGASNGGADHIGIVVGIENNKLITIEGNTSNTVAYRSYDLNSPCIRAILDITYDG